MYLRLVLQAIRLCIDSGVSILELSKKIQIPEQTLYRSFSIKGDGNPSVYLVIKVLKEIGEDMSIIDKYLYALKWIAFNKRDME